MFEKGEFEKGKGDFELADATALIATALYYAFFLLGSVSLGYVFLRLTQPEIRAKTRRAKLLFSLAVGLAFTLMAAGLEYALNGSAAIESLENANAMTPLYVLGIALVCFAVFKTASALKNAFRGKRTMEVAVAAPAEKQGAARLLPFVQEVRKFEPAPEPAVSSHDSEDSSNSGVETDGRRSVRDKLAALKAKGVINERPAKAGEAAAATEAFQTRDETPKPAAGVAVQAEALKIEQPKQPAQTATHAAPIPKPTEPSSLQNQKNWREYQALQAKQTPQEKKGFFQKIFGGGGGAKKNAAGQSAAQQPRKPPKPSGAAGEEQDIEVILSELHLIKAPAPIARKPLPLKPGQKQSPQFSQTQQEEGPAQRHRLYLERRGGAGGGGGSGDSRARLEQERSEKQELNALFSDVYSQLDKPGNPGAARTAAQRGAAARGAAGGATAVVDEKPLSMNDLFSTESGNKKEGAENANAAAGAAGGSGSSVFSQLENLDAAGGESKPASAAPEGEAKAQVQVVKMEVGKNAGCPHCGAKNVRVVFCPYCGSGMCANCTPSLKPTPEAFVYTCPKCGEEVPVARAKKA